MGGVAKEVAGRRAAAHAVSRETPTPELFTVKEVAAYLNVHTSTIYRMLRQGILPAFKIGSDWRFHREAIDRWIKAQSRGHAGD